MSNPMKYGKKQNVAIFTLGDTGGTIERGFMDGRPLIFEFGLVMQEGTPATPGISGDYEKTVRGGLENSKNPGGGDAEDYAMITEPP